MRFPRCWAYRETARGLYDGEAGVELLGGVRFADCGDVDARPHGLEPTATTPRIHRRRAGAVRGGPLPRRAGRRPLHHLPRAQGAPRGARRRARCSSSSSTPTRTTGTTRAAERYTHASPIIRSHEDEWSAVDHPVRHPRPAHRRRQHRPGAEPRGAHLLVRAGEGDAASTSSSRTSSRASTPTSPSTSTALDPASRRAPARPSRAASATTKPRRSCSPCVRAAT